MTERTTQMKNRFLQFKDWEDRYKELITLGKQLATYPEDKRDDKYKVKGCQSQVWLCPEFKEGRVYFHADSDALLVKGIRMRLRMKFFRLSQIFCLKSESLSTSP